MHEPLRSWPLAAALLSLTACATLPPPPAPAPIAPPAVAVEARPPVTILVSIDGFRADYLKRGLSPRLAALAAGGVTAAMRPAFPSKTFPNHWTLVTGLTPDHHGIVANAMEDPGHPNEKFTMQSEQPFWWNGAVPIWVDAEKAGIRTATMFWPGANVAVGGTEGKVYGYNAFVGGIRPSDWQQYTRYVTGAQRVETVLDWMRRPAAIRPRFVTLYFDTVDSAGHEGGPDSPGVNAEIASVDRDIGALVDGLADLGQPANLVIVADHGMAATSDSRHVPAATLAAAADARLFESGPYASFYPVPGHEAALERTLLKPHPHVRCWRKAEIPARFRYGTNPRIPPYFCLADTGWLITDKAETEHKEGGTHGYDNATPEMAALFIAQGPAFARGRTVPPFDNVDVAPLLRDLIGLAPKAADGSDAPFRGVMRR